MRLTSGFPEAATSRLFRIKGGKERGAAELRRLMLLQFCNFLSIATMGFFALLYCFIDFNTLWPIASLSLVCIPFYAFSALLNRSGWAQSAKQLFFFTFFVSILVSTTLFIGKAPGLHFYFLLAAVLPLLIWSLNRPFWIIVYMTANLGGFVFIHFRTDQSGILIPNFPPSWVFFFNLMSIITVYAVTVVILGFFQKRADEDASALRDRARTMEELMHRFEELSNTDTLTGLHNRRSMLRRMDEEKIRLSRNHSNFAIMIADIDLFKSVNDTYGHEAGDKVLIAIGRTLQGSLREIDHVARWGGEEFLILLPDTSAEGAATVAEKIRQRVADTVIDWADHPIRCTITLGIAVCDRDNPDLDRTIREADDALYEGKKNGRNLVVYRKEKAAQA